MSRRAELSQRPRTAAGCAGEAAASCPPARRSLTGPSQQQGAGILGDITNVVTRQSSMGLSSCPGAALGPLPPKSGGIGLGLGGGVGALAGRRQHSLSGAPVGGSALPPPSGNGPGTAAGVLACPTGAAPGSIGVPSTTTLPPPTRAAPMQVCGPEDVDVDVADLEDPQHVAEYTVDIFRRLTDHERDLLPRAGYMDQQPEINAKMRAILVDWLVEVHTKYRLKMETLFLAVNLIDRFLSLRQVTRKRLQLVGVSGMLIAAKFEEIYPPETREFVYITDNAYSKEELLGMEISMLTTLGFNICCPTVAHFLDRFQRVNRCSEEHKYLMQYILELTLPEFTMIRYSPSHLVAAAALFSNKLLRKHPSWPSSVERLARQEFAQVRECARELCGLYEAAEHDTLQAVRRKFSQAAYKSVAKTVFS